MAAIAVILAWGSHAYAKLYREMIELFPKEGRYVAALGANLVQREEYAEAEEQFRGALKLNPRSSWVWYNIGMLYMEQRNWQKA